MNATRAFSVDSQKPCAVVAGYGFGFTGHLLTDYQLPTANPVLFIVVLTAKSVNPAKM